MLYICEATCKNGKACSHKARFGKFCGKHTPTKTRNSCQSKNYDRECEECECPICYNPLSKPITCPNGHKVCQEHYLQHINAVYDDDWRVPKGICFMCRAELPSSCFTKNFILQLPFIFTKAHINRESRLRGQPQSDIFHDYSISVATEMLQFLNIHL